MKLRPLDPVCLNLSGRMLIEASAGTGKTYTISSLFVRFILEQGLLVDDILVVTFTRAATQDLKEKIRERIKLALELLRKDEDFSGDEFLSRLFKNVSANGLDSKEMENRLRAALLSMDQASIFTIHSFCQRMLTEFAFETGMSFGFDIDVSKDETVQIGLEHFFREHVAGLRPDLIESIKNLLTSGKKRGFFECTKHVLSSLGNMSGFRFPTQKGFRDVIQEKERLDELIDSLRGRWHKEADDFFQDLNDALLRALEDLFDLIEERAAFTPKALSHLRTYFRKRINKWLDDDRKKIHDFLSFHPYISKSPCAMELDRVQVVFDPDPALVFSTIYRDLLGLQTCQKEKKEKEKEFAAILNEYAQMQPAVERSQDGLLSSLAALREFVRHFDQELFYSFIRLLIDQVGEFSSAYRLQRRLVSYDDMLVLLQGALKGAKGKRLASLIRGKYKAVMIDEFQDTDPLQWDIFSSIFTENEDLPMILIGDPKQAIYSFRGGDIFTYLRARQSVREDKRFYLDTNWRSSSGYVEAVNALFSSSNENPFFLKDLAFLEVKPRSPDPSRLVIEKGSEGLGDSEKSLFFLTLEKESQGNDKYFPYCTAVARQIKQLLSLSENGQAYIEDIEGARQQVRPADIAILVRDFMQAESVQRALSRLRIPSIYQSKKSVFKSKEARELFFVLRAVLNPRDEASVATALSTVMLGWNAPAISSCLNDVEEWDKVLGLFEELKSIWASKGVMACFFKMMRSFQIPERVLALVDGDRRMTNLRQLAEALGARETEKLCQMDGLLSWLKEKMDFDAGVSEDEMLRLETDEQAVRILTYHKSKGLEFPILFLPFLGSIRGFEDEFLKRVYSYDEKGYVVFHSGLTAREDLLREWKIQKKSENARLIYVALTRAKYRCYLGFEGLNHPGESLFFEMTERARFSDSRETGLLSLLEKLSRQVQASQVITIGSDFLGDFSKEAEEGDSGLNKGRILELQRSPIAPQVFTVSSFSALSSHGPGERALPLEFEPKPVEERPHSIFSFPRGAASGSFLHEVLEDVDFQAGKEEILLAAGECMTRWNVDEVWTDVVLEMVQNVLSCQIHPGLRLRDIPPEAQRREMDFRWAFLEDKVFKAILEPLFPQVRQGVISGFIDLVFEWKGRFYIADYKSNWIGDSLKDYRRDMLEREMEANDYFLQAGIYAKAVHLFAGNLVPGYSFERNFGGVFYLFLRGIRREIGAESGVYFMSPRELVERMPWVRQ